MTTPPHPISQPPAMALGARALLALDRTQGADPASFRRRREEWRIWSHRTHLAVHLANTLGVAVETVTGSDDPHRSYGQAGQYPGDLLTISDAHTGQLWKFIPDLDSSGPDWLLLGTCPHCLSPSVPIARIAGLADLGAFCQANTDEDHTTLAELLPNEFTADAAHRPGCSAGR